MVTAQRCPACWLGPEECSERETPPYEVAGWIVCPRCPGGLVTEQDDESDQAALSRAIREAAANKQTRAAGGGGSGGGRKRTKLFKADAHQVEKPEGRPEPERRVVGRENVDPRTEVFSFAVSAAVCDWLDSQALRRGCFNSDVIREVLGEAMAKMGEAVDVCAGEKAARTSPAALSLSPGEQSFLFRLAECYGVSPRTFVYAVCHSAMKRYYENFREP